MDPFRPPEQSATYRPSVVPYLRTESEPTNVVPAAVTTGFHTPRLVELENAWAPERLALAECLGREGTVLENVGWNWVLMHRAREHCLIAVEADGAIQGMMAIETRLRSSLLTPNALALYVDYLEVAPWNVTNTVRARRFAWVGQVLLRAAVLQSLGTAAAGRVRLVSLPQAEEFYRRCQMVDVGIDPDYELVRFEYVRATALHVAGGALGEP
jgi:hypothetical protein